MTRVGALTIGQAPRDDVAPEFLAAAGAGIELVQAGALDGLSREEIAALAPTADPCAEGCMPSRRQQVLVTRLRDRSEVVLEEDRILDLLRKGLGRLEAAGVDCIALFCTGEFPEFSAKVPILRPDRILAHFVASVAAGTGSQAASRICAIVPSPLQVEEIRGKWLRLGFGVEVEPLSPYSSTPLDAEACALRAKAHRPDLIVLDCIGYSGAVKSVFSRVCGVPVVLPRTLLGRVAAELARA